MRNDARRAVAHQLFADGYNEAEDHRDTAAYITTTPQDQFDRNFDCAGVFNPLAMLSTNKAESMARARRNDDRLLSKDEQTLVAQTRHPLIKTLADRDLSNVVMRLREHRDRARDIGRFKRSELRSQSMKTSMIGVERAVSESDGHRAKRTILVAAVKRANKEAERRRITNARGELVSDAERARSMKKAARIEAQLLSTRTAHGGVQPTPSTDLAPWGAWKQEGHRPVLERSRKVR